jgi:hypothetical protein
MNPAPPVMQDPNRHLSRAPLHDEMEIAGVVPLPLDAAADPEVHRVPTWGDVRKLIKSHGCAPSVWSRERSRTPASPSTSLPTAFASIDSKVLGVSMR